MGAEHRVGRPDCSEALKVNIGRIPIPVKGSLDPMQEAEPLRRQEYKGDRVFDDPKDANRYAKHMAKMNVRYGRQYAGLLKEWGFKAGRILDSGCGAGEIPVELAKALPHAEVVGVDLSEPLLEIARRSAEAASVTDRATFERADVTRLPFEDDAFDAVVNVNMVHIVEDPVSMLNEIERVLASEGWLIIAAIRRSWFAYLAPIFKTAYTLPEAKELLGRTELRQGDYGSGFLWWAHVSYPGMDRPK